MLKKQYEKLKARLKNEHGYSGDKDEDAEDKALTAIEEKSLAQPLSPPENTPLHRHIKAFGGGQERVTRALMAALNAKLRDRDGKARALRVAFVGAMATGECPFKLAFNAKNAVGKLNHKQSTRMYKLDGNIDEDKWAALQTYGKKDSGQTSVLYKDDFYLFLRVCRAAETDANCANRFFGKKASDGEWLLYWTLFGETDSNGKEYVKMADLREFYEDSQISINKLLAKYTLEEKPEVTQESKYLSEHVSLAARTAR